MRSRRGVSTLVCSAVACVVTGILVLPAAWAGAQSASSNPQVSTDKGAVVGSVDQKIGVRTFLGIPYAAPPVGALRWQPPRPAASWSAPRQATTLGSACEQNVNTSFGQPTVGVSEDCLFLNVYTPLSGSHLPVVVWFHGGGYTGGQGGDYDGRFYASQRHQIVVTVNYRLGAFGFLATNSLNATSSTHTSGNYGFEDQQAALRWVQKNIASFGGNAGNVTITGQSAGAGSVCFHTVSPQSRGLFEAGILMSGTCAFRFQPIPTLQQIASQGDTIAAQLGCSGTDAAAAACLRAKSPQSILAATGGGSTGGATTLPLGPLVDGRIIPQQPETLVKSGRFNKVPLMMGNVLDEGTIFVFLNHVLAGAPPVTAAEYPSLVQATTLPQGITVDEVVQHYPLSSYPSPNQALAQVMTDESVCQIDAQTKLFAKWVPTYAYEFADRDAPNLAAPIAKAGGLTLGANHGIDIQYVFKSEGIPLVSATPAPFDTAQNAVSNSIGSYWAHFAATGNPGSAGGPAWPRFQAGSPERVRYDTGGTTLFKNLEQEHQCSFWLSTTH
jgi:para-nitrobenzyl esterase